MDILFHHQIGHWVRVNFEKDRMYREVGRFKMVYSISKAYFMQKRVYDSTHLKLICGYYRSNNYINVVYETIFPQDLAKCVFECMGKQEEDIYLIIQSEKEFRIKKLEYHLDAQPYGWR